MKLSHQACRFSTALLFGSVMVSPSYLVAQDSIAADEEEEVYTLSPFEVTNTEDRGYRAAASLAGTRLRTDLKDIGSSISVYTEAFLDDVGATDNETLLTYATNMEVGGPRGNYSGGVSEGASYQEQDLFANPNANTRVRGLTSADNTRNYFISDIPWDGYSISRVDIQRGPNGILFGLGSPAGVINATTKSATYQDAGSFDIKLDKYGSMRLALDYNKALIEDELAVRLMLLRNDQKFQQDPAFQLDERFYATVKYEPKALNQGESRLTISGNFEHGNIDSNRPRTLTPGDNFTGFWDPESAGGVGNQTYNPFTTDLKNVESPDYTDNLGNAGEGSILRLVNSNRSVDWTQNAIPAWGALRPDGTVVEGTIDEDANGAYPRRNSLGQVGVRDYGTWASVAGLPFGNFGQYSNKTITDPTVFNFYDKLIDGDNKREWTNWNTFDMSVSQTFFGDSLGYEISHFEQNLDRGQWSVLGWSNKVYMDINEAVSLGIPNPDVGRAYVQIENRDGGNGTTASDRDATRLQLFSEYDFMERHDGFLARLFGKQRLTGVLSEENHQQDVRSARYADLDYESKKLFSPNPVIEGAETMNSGFRYYISDDLRGQSGAAGSHLNRMMMPVFDPQGGAIAVRAFDNTWTAGPGVDPGAPWANPYRPGDDYTQSNNPANYLGWTDRQASYVTVESDRTVNGMSAREYLTSSGNLSDFGVESKILAWQGYFWDGALVGTFGYREDEAASYLYNSSDRSSTGRSDTGGADLNPTSYNFQNPNGSTQDIETTTRNWSGALHLNKLLGDRDFLPINVSLYYNEGENFQPLAGRIDAFARPLDPPNGNTEEQSILLATKDSKYSLRATHYETQVFNGNSTSSIGTMWALEQQVREGGNQLRKYRGGTSPYSNWSNAGGDIDYLQDTIMPAWFQFEKDLDATFPGYVDAWFGPDSSFATDSNDQTFSQAPAGFAYTEDSFSEGYEFEFTASPTDNWRIALNASKTKATRENVPGKAFKEMADFVDSAMQTTPVGLAPVWWDANVAGGRNVGPYSIFRPDYLKNAALNGQSAGEVREWRANLVTNYSFTDGRFDGLGIGGGYRWEDDAIVDYAPMITEAGDNAINLDAPFTAPAESTVDFWVSYSRPISDNVNWKLQLNVYNAFGDDELIPFAASVDYATLEGVTITPDTVIPMVGSAFTIKQGTSWSITNTFEF